MWFIGKLSRDKRGAGSIVGAVFIFLIIITGFTFYFLNVNVTEDYTKTVQDMQQLDLKRNKENIGFIGVSFNGDTLNITVKNTGSYQAHLIWLGIFDDTVSPTAQEYYKIDFYVEPAETVPAIHNETIPTFEGEERVIQLVTELGNTFSYSYPPSEGDSAGQASVTITGVNCTAEYNPSQWNLLGSTTDVSGSASNLTRNDENYVFFRSYYTGTGTDINDFVDNNISDVDSSTNKGAHLNFTAQQYGPDSIMDTLLEGDTSGGPGQWASPTGYEDPGDGWSLETNAYDDDPSSFAWTWVPADSWSQYFILTHGAMTCGKIQYLIRRQSADIDQVEVDIYNGTWTNVYSGTGSWWIWTNISFTETSVTKMRFRFFNSHSSRWRWVIFYEADFLQSLPNYELDLEVEWTDVDYDEANEWLCIYGGTMGSENITVDVWYNDSWQNLDISDLSSGWNNISVSSYLISSNFIIRFRDGTNTSDTTPDSWDIDVTLLHVWTEADEYTAEVEFTGSSNLEDWTRLVWQIDSCWDIGEVNTTIQFYNHTLGDYASSGNGYVNYISDTTPNTDELKSQTIASNPDSFKNSTGHWTVKIKGVKATSTQFLMKIDWIELTPTYSSSGNSIPYNAWQWYTIDATTAGGDTIPYAYISIYTNGTNMAFRNAIDKESIPNPGWVRLNADGEYHLETNSTNGTGETFVLYAVVGSVVGQKTITQEAQ